MTKNELIRLNALVKKFKRQSNKLYHQVDREYKHAGHSETPEGTGDEGWMQVNRKGGMARGMESAAAQLSDLIRKLQSKVKR